MGRLSTIMVLQGMYFTLIRFSKTRQWNASSQIRKLSRLFRFIDTVRDLHKLAKRHVTSLVSGLTYHRDFFLIAIRHRIEPIRPAHPPNQNVIYMDNSGRRLES
jgi:hypothetical protein